MHEPEAPLGAEAGFRPDGLHTAARPAARCPGVIDTNPGNYCNLHTTNGNYNAITFLTQAYQTIDAGTVGQYGYCWAGDPGQYYINARWVYSSCPFGVEDCGFAIQQANGSF